MSGKHSSSGSFGESVGILLFIGAIWFLVWAWPWWLLAIPAGFLFWIAVRPEFRTRVKASFLCEKVNEETSRFRRSFLFWLLALGTLSIIVCTFAVGLDTLPWWLVPMSLLMLGFRLSALHGKETGIWSRLVKAVSANMFELLLMATVTLTAYSLAVAWLLTVSLDDMTLDALRNWDKLIRETHEFFEKYAPGLKTFLVFLGVIVALRIITTVRPTLASLTSRTTTTLAKGSKWIGRVSTMIAIAASVTFLAVDAGSPVSQISLEFRDATKDYEHFKGVVSEKTDHALRQAIIDKAWNARPVSLKTAMESASKFQREREEFDELSREARTHEVQQDLPPDIPGELDLSKGSFAISAAPADDASRDWTRREIHQAAEAVSAMPSNDDSSVANSESKDLDELSKDAFEKLMPADHLFESSAFLSTMKAHYPVFGEFLEAIASSLSEVSFDRLRDSIVRTVTSRRSRRADIPLDRLITRQVATKTAGIQINLQGFNDAWGAQRDSEFQRYSTEIAFASSGLQAAEAKQLAILQSEGRAPGEKIGLLDGPDLGFEGVNPGEWRGSLLDPLIRRGKNGREYDWDGLPRGPEVREVRPPIERFRPIERPMIPRIP